MPKCARVCHFASGMLFNIFMDGFGIQIVRVEFDKLKHLFGIVMCTEMQANICEALFCCWA